MTQAFGSRSLFNALMAATLGAWFALGSATTDMFSTVFAADGAASPPPGQPAAASPPPVQAGAPTPDSPPTAAAQATAPTATPTEKNGGEAKAESKPLAADPPGMKRLSPKYDVWLDPVKKRIVVDGVVCLREGYLEMFACPRNTKEHESIVSVDVEPHIIHAGLLAVGAKTGTPARWQPKYEPATGTPIDITLIWTDGQGVVHRDAAEQWVRNSRTKQALDTTWVFAGSSFRDDTDARRYRADEGDFICVSNFPDAMLDLPIESSESNDDRTFEAFTEHIPPRGARVRMVLTPRLEAKAAEK